MALNFDDAPPLSSLYGQPNAGNFNTKSTLFSENEEKLDFDIFDSSSAVEEDLGEDYSVANLAQHSGFVSMADRYLDQRYGSSRDRGESSEDVVDLAKRPE